MTRLKITEEIQKILDKACEVCHDCGTKYGKHITTCSTWHYSTCDICKKENVPVTEPRDFNYFRK